MAAFGQAKNDKNPQNLSSNPAQTLVDGELSVESAMRFPLRGFATGFVGVIFLFSSRVCVNQSPRQYGLSRRAIVFKRYWGGGSMIIDNIPIKTIIDSLPLYLFFKDTDSVYTGCNENFANFMGFDSADKVIGKTENELFQYLQAPTKSLKNFLRSGDWDALINEPFNDQAFDVTLPNGLIMSAELTKSPLLDQYGKIIGIMGCFRDVSHIKQLEKSALCQCKQCANAHYYQGQSVSETAFLPRLLTDWIEERNQIRLLNNKEKAAIPLINLSIDRSVATAFVDIDLCWFKQLLSELIDSNVEDNQTTITLTLSRQAENAIIEINRQNCDIHRDFSIAHAIDFAKRHNGKLNIESHASAKTNTSDIQLHLPLTEPPTWFSQQITLPPNATVLILTKNEVIDHFCTSRLKMLAGIKTLKVIQQVEELIRHLNNTADLRQIVFLIDHNFCNHSDKPDTLQFIDSLQLSELSKISYLITDDEDDNKTVEIASAMRLKLIPRFLLPLIPMIVESPTAQTKTIHGKNDNDRNERATPMH